MGLAKVCKKGEFLYREGESANRVFLIQSGSVQVFMQRQKQSIDLMTLGGMQMAGEHAFFGQTQNPHSAVCLTETKVVEFSVDEIKGQLELSSPNLKTIVASLIAKSKTVYKELQSARLERDNNPCPPETTAKLFAAFFFSMKAKGELQKDQSLRADWPFLKRYMQGMFLENAKRADALAQLLVKLGVAKVEMRKNEADASAPEEVGWITVADLNAIEQFFEYQQYYHFKGAAQTVLKTDERMMTLVESLIALGATQPEDRRGLRQVEAKRLIDDMRSRTGLAFSMDQFTLLEHKGLFVKRISQDNGVLIEFEHREFVRVHKIWLILREIEKWNEKGFVDMTPTAAARKRDDHACPKCQTAFTGAPKFCGECGQRLDQAA
jgi:hypothetical protein